MKRLSVLSFALLLLTGCLTICRHKVLSDYAWAVEQGYRPEIVLYTTTSATRAAALWIWNGHVQVTAGEKWVSGGTFQDDPEWPFGVYCWRMTLEQYIDWLYDYKRSSSEPYIEHPEWPRCGP